MEKNNPMLNGVQPKVAERVTENMLANPRLKGLDGFNPIRNATIMKTFDGRECIMLSTAAMMAWYNAYCAAHDITPRICEMTEESNKPFIEKVRVDVYFNGTVIATGVASGLYETVGRDLCRDDATRVQSTATKAKRRALEMAGFALLDDGLGLNPEDLPQYPPDEMGSPAPALTTAPAPETSVPKADDAPAQPVATGEDTTPKPNEPPKKRGRKPKSSDAAQKPGAADMPTVEDMTLEEALAWPCEFPSMKGLTMKEVWEKTNAQTFEFWTSDAFQMKDKYPQSVQAAKVIFAAFTEAGADYTSVL